MDRTLQRIPLGAGKEEISEESVTIKVRDHKVTGTLTGMHAHRRLRQFDGEFSYDFLVLKFFAAKVGRVGASAIVLKGKAEAGLLKGYWLGYDPELGKLVAAPYVLTRDQNIERAKMEQRQWLDQPCYSGAREAV